MYESREKPSFEYLFRLVEAEFNKDIHALTGLIDQYEHPIIRMRYPNPTNNPIGFGRDQEWKFLS